MLSELAPDGLTNLNRFVGNIFSAFGQDVLDIRQQLNCIKNGDHRKARLVTFNELLRLFIVSKDNQSLWKR